MTETPSTPDTGTPKKTRKPPPPERLRGKCSLSEFRSLLEKIIGHPEVFSDDQIRWAGQILHAGAEDTDGTIRITWSSAPSAAAKAFRFTRTLRVSGEMPQDDIIRQQTREIALIADENLALGKIDGLSDEFLRRAAALYGFRADSAIGLKSAFANVVHDIREMENIASSGARKKPDTTEGGANETSFT
jgi:hypothetical protein